MTGPITCAACGHTRADHRRGGAWPTDDGPTSCMFCDCTRSYAAIDGDTAAPATQPHESVVEHSGDFVRVVCDCGEAGEWRPRKAATLQRLLHSDINAHIWALKRMEAQR